MQKTIEEMQTVIDTYHAAITIMREQGKPISSLLEMADMAAAAYITPNESMSVADLQSIATSDNDSPGIHGHKF